MSLNTPKRKNRSCSKQVAYNTDSNDSESDDRSHLIEYISTGEHSIVGDSQFNRTGPRGGTVMHLGKAYQVKIIKSGTLE